MEAITIRKFSKVSPNSDDLLEFRYIVHPTTNHLWFKGSSVSKSLKYATSSKAVTKLVAKDNKMLWKDLTAGFEVKNLPKNWQPITTMIDEAGFNQLMMRSTMSMAQEYVNWVCTDVLPSIRKTGCYIHPIYASQEQQTTTVVNYNNDPTIVEKIRRLQHENSKMQLECYTTRCKNTELVTMNEELAKKAEELTRNLQNMEQLYQQTQIKYITQKVLTDHTLVARQKAVSVINSIKGRVIPNIQQKLPKKVHIVALYVLDKNSAIEYHETNRPNHYISRSQKERIDKFDKIIARCNTSVSNMVVEQADSTADSTNVTIHNQSAVVPESCSWLQYATCYVKECCPNAITQWIDTKYSNQNPIWFGMTMRYNHIKFLTKNQLQTKFSSLKPAANRKFCRMHNISNDDDLIRKCYTPYEKEKEVLQSLIKESLKRTQNEYEIADSLMLSIKDVPIHKIQEYFNKPSDPDEDQFVQDLVNRRMITY